MHLPTLKAFNCIMTVSLKSHGIYLFEKYIGILKKRHNNILNVLFSFVLYR